MALAVFMCHDLCDVVTSPQHCARPKSLMLPVILVGQQAHWQLTYVVHLLISTIAFEVAAFEIQCWRGDEEM